MRQCFAKNILLADLAVGLRSDARLNTNKVKQLVDSIVGELADPPPPSTRAYFRLQQRIKEQNLVLAKADKGEALILLSKTNYSDEVLEFLHKANATPLRYKFTEYNTKIRAVLDKPSQIFGNKGEFLKQMVVAVPRIYGQIKMHKAGQPIRPVVAYYTHPSFKLAKFLATWFKESAGFSPRYTVLNSVALVQELKMRTFPLGSRLVSFDDVNMYTNVPVQLTIDIMVSHLRNQQIHQDAIDEFKVLMKLCLEDNICHFQGKTYQFPDGLPMGGPLSSLVADAFLSHMEDQLLRDPAISQNIVFYKRYVDDILCIWNGSDEQLNLTLAKLNSFHPAMKFVMEIGDQVINFLDLTLRLSHQYSGKTLTQVFLLLTIQCIQSNINWLPLTMPSIGY